MLDRRRAGIKGLDLARLSGRRNGEVAETAAVVENSPRQVGQRHGFKWVQRKLFCTDLALKLLVEKSDAGVIKHE
jgi:hypothetical protein